MADNLLSIHSMIQNVAETKVAKKYDGSFPFPRDRYTLRCLDQSFGPSKSSGNPMISLNWEIVGCNGSDKIVHNDQEYVIAGLKIFSMNFRYFTTVVLEDGVRNAEKTKEVQAKLKDFSDKIGADIDWTTWDDENPPLKYEGVVVEAVLGSEDNTARKAQTPEQKARKQPGDPIKDEQGNPVMKYQPRIEDVYGKSSVKINAPY